MPYERPYPGGWRDVPDLSTSITAAALDIMDDGIDAASAQADAAAATASAASAAVAGKAPLLEGINNVVASGSGTVAIPNPVSTLKTYNKVVLTGNCTITLPTVAEAGVVSITLQLIQDGTGGRTPTLPSITWVGGAAPAIASGAGDTTEIVLWTEGSGGGWFGLGQAAAPGGGTGLLTVSTMSSAGTAHGGNIYELDTTSGAFLVTVEASAVATGDVVLKWVKGTAAPTVVFTAGDHWNLTTNSAVPTFERINQAYRLSPNNGTLWVGSGLDYPPSALLKTSTPGALLAALEFWPTAAQTSDAVFNNTTVTDLAAAALDTTAAGTGSRTAWAGVTSTTFDLTFTPTTSAVKIRITGKFKGSAAGFGCKMSLLDVGAAATVANSAQIVNEGTNQSRWTYVKTVSGLTPGVALTYRIQAVASGGTVSWAVGGVQGPVEFTASVA